MTDLAELVNGLNREDWPVLAFAVLLGLVGFCMVFFPTRRYGEPSSGGGVFLSAAVLLCCAAALGLYWFFTS